MAHFGVVSHESANLLLDRCSHLSWALLPVALCETRQAFQGFGDDGFTFKRILMHVRKQLSLWAPLIQMKTEFLVAAGATSKECFSLRLFRLLLSDVVRWELER